MSKEPGLFSLELVVDFVENLNVPCIVPAIAFRLVDMPTVVIHLLNPCSVTTLRAHSRAVTNRIPGEVQNLKNADGRFRFRKGKSCLFKMTFDRLRRHLMTTPLYFMLLDVWKEPACLVGTATIRLDRAVEEIGRSISSLGRAIPAAWGAKGTHTVYNLMGSKVGEVRLAYRLYSLGPVLESHVAMKPIEKGEEKEKEGDDGSSVPILPEALPVLTNEIGENGEKYEANTLCPPPMYYNSRAADVEASVTATTDDVEEEEEEEEIVEQPVDLETENEHWKTLMTSGNPNARPLVVEDKEKRAAMIVSEEDAPLPRTSPFPAQFSLLNGLLLELKQLENQKVLSVEEKREEVPVEAKVDLPEEKRVDEENTPPDFHQGPSPSPDTLSRLTSLVYERLKLERKRKPVYSKQRKKAPVREEPKSYHVGSCQQRHRVSPLPYRNLTYFAQFSKKQRAPAESTPTPFAYHKRRKHKGTTLEQSRNQKPKSQREKEVQTQAQSTIPGESLTAVKERLRSGSSSKTRSSSSSSPSSSSSSSSSSRSSKPAVGSSRNSNGILEVRLPEIVINDEADLETKEEEEDEVVVERSLSPSTHSSLHVEDLLAKSDVKFFTPSPISPMSGTEGEEDEIEPLESSLPKIASLTDLKPISSNAEDDEEEEGDEYSDDFENKTDSEDEGDGSETSSVSGSSRSVHHSGYSSSLSSAGSARPIIQSIDKLTSNPNFGYTF